MVNKENLLSNLKKAIVKNNKSPKSPVIWESNDQLFVKSYSSHFKLLLDWVTEVNESLQHGKLGVVFFTETPINDFDPEFKYGYYLYKVTIKVK